MAILCAACSSAPSDAGSPSDADAPSDVSSPSGVIPLTEDEVEILELMGEDVQVISEEEYPEMVTELQAHIGEFDGQVFQLEGTFTTTELNGDETPFVYRTLVHDGEKTQCGLPIRYLQKELPEGSWIRISAIINSFEYGGESYTTLEAVEVETLAEPGSAELDWDGVGHSH